MTIAVVGLGHLGAVISAGLAQLGSEVMGVDSDPDTIAMMQKGAAAFHEPGLQDTIQQMMLRGVLRYTAECKAISEAALVWIAYDTPVNENDVADVTAVLSKITALFPFIRSETVVILSSQLPVGSTDAVQQAYDKAYPLKRVYFTYSPENLCLGNALTRFISPDRVVMGIADPAHASYLFKYLPMFREIFLFMSIRSAEMSKHAINAFLASSIVFINEIATLCEQVGAEAKDVAAALKSDMRIGPRAYLQPGHAFSGGTLARDVQYLQDKKTQHRLKLPLIEALLPSNGSHKQWIHRHLLHCMDTLAGKTIALLGLSYKSGTQALHRSFAIELATQLIEQGARIQAYDPTVSQPVIGVDLNITTSAEAALQAADLCIITTEWPVFQSLTPEIFLFHLRNGIVLDPGGYLHQQLADDPRIRYLTVGGIR